MLKFLMSPPATRAKGVYDPEKPVIGRDFYIPEKGLFGRVEAAPFSIDGWTYTRFFNEEAGKWENRISIEEHGDVNNMRRTLKSNRRAREILGTAIEKAIYSMENPRPTTRPIEF